VLIQLLIFQIKLNNYNKIMGKIYPVSIPAKTLKQAITSSDSTFQLNDILDWNGDDLTEDAFGDEHYIAFRNSANTKIEFMKIDVSTIADDSITIDKRGLRTIGEPDDTEVEANKLDWNANETIVELGTNVPQLYYQYINKYDAQTIEGVKTFQNTSRPLLDSDVDATDDKEFVGLGQLNRTALGTTLTNRVVVAGTAGETVAAGEVVYFDETDKEWKLADGSASATCENVLLGIAQGAGTDDNTISGGVLLEGLDTNQSGFTEGDIIYISDTAGTLADSTGTVEAIVGYAKSATDIYFKAGLKRFLTEDQQDALVGTYPTASPTPNSSNKYVNNPIIDSHTDNTAGYLTGGDSAQSAFASWATITDGSFRVTVDGTAYNVDAIDFSGDGSMDDVASTIQTALQTATSGSETVVWSTDHFIITSGTSDEDSEISVLSTSTGTVGTDISGAGASDWMDCDTGNGVATQGTSDHEKLVKLDTEGKIAKEFDKLNIKTLTAGETIAGATLPVAVYQDSSDNKIYACDGNDTDKLNFIGFAITTADDTEDIIVQMNGIVSGFTELAERTKYYVQDDKTIEISIGTYELLVGIAISETELLIQKGSFQLIKKDTISADNGSTQASDASSIPSGTRFIIFECASYSLEGGTYGDQTYGNVILDKNFQTEAYIMNGTKGTSSATDFDGVKVSWASTTLTIATVGFLVGGDRTIYLRGTAYFYS
jgi:hypothetical protein